MAKAKPDPDEKPMRENALERDPRFPIFAEKYVELRGNGHKAALVAGYPEDYARAHAHQLVARLKLKIGPVMRAYGLDEIFVVKKIKKLSRAKEPRWNPNRVVKAAIKDVDGKEISPEIRGDWDVFEAGGIQLGALNVAVKLLALEPATKFKLQGSGAGGSIPVVITHSIPQPDRSDPKVTPPAAGA